MDHLPLPLDLEDWLTDCGDEIAHKIAAQGEAALTKREKLIHEIWLLDTETRNGGLSQYFANWGLAQWNECCSLPADSIPTFPAFAKHVFDLLKGHADPYEAMVAKEREADELYYSCQVSIVSELRDAVTRRK